MRIKIPPRLACVATLPCETLMSAKQAINDKLQGSVAAYLRCGGVVNNQKKKICMAVHAAIGALSPVCNHTVTRILTGRKRPVWARGRCRISPPRFLAECCKRQLNQGSFVLLTLMFHTVV